MRPPLLPSRTARYVMPTEAPPITEGEAVEKCRTELATNFDRPARDILAEWGSRIGLDADRMRLRIWKGI